MKPTNQNHIRSLHFDTIAQMEAENFLNSAGARAIAFCRQNNEFYYLEPTSSLPASGTDVLVTWNPSGIGRWIKKSVVITPHHGRRIYVDANMWNDSSWEKYNITKPFQTINAAMASVTLPWEEVVHVFSWEYDENDQIDMTTHMECSANVTITKTWSFVSTIINNNGFDIIGYPHIQMNTWHFSAVWANGGRVELGRVFGTPSSTSSRVILVNQVVVDPINIHIQEIDNGWFGNPIYRHTSAAKTQEVNIKIGRCKNGYGTFQNVFAMLGDSNVYHKIHCDFVESLGADMYEFTPSTGNVVEFSGTYSKGGWYAVGMSIFALNDMKVDSLWMCECNVMEINNVDSTDSLSPNPFVNGAWAITTVWCRTRNANLPSAALGITWWVFVTWDTNVQLY